MREVEEIGRIYPVIEEMRLYKREEHAMYTKLKKKKKNPLS